MNTALKIVLIGCGALVLVVAGAILLFGIWVSTSPEGGVKLPNEMDRYALDYLAEHKLLEPGEELLAYYDVTMSMDGTEAAIVTTERVLYHKGGETTSIPIDDIETINHRYESLIGDVVEIHASTGQVMKIEIAPLNQGETLKNVLMGRWERSADGPLEAGPG